MAGKRGSFEDRFWLKVQKTAGCWLWTATPDKSGYGRLSLGGKGSPIIRAPRAAWIICRGPIPDGLFVLHSCDNPACVRPDHLFLGTQHDNWVDMLRKGRARGKQLGTPNAQRDAGGRFVCVAE